MSIIAVIPIVLLFLGVFDRFGKDEIDNKANSFNTNDQDKYLVRMMPGENIKSMALVVIVKVKTSLY